MEQLMKLLDERDSLVSPFIDVFKAVNDLQIQVDLYQSQDQQELISRLQVVVDKQEKEIKRLKELVGEQFFDFKEDYI